METSTTLPQLVKTAHETLLDMESESEDPRDICSFVKRNQLRTRQLPQSHYNLIMAGHVHGLPLPANSETTLQALSANIECSHHPPSLNSAPSLQPQSMNSTKLQQGRQQLGCTSHSLANPESSGRVLPSSVTTDVNQLSQDLHHGLPLPANSETSQQLLSVNTECSQHPTSVNSTPSQQPQLMNSTESQQGQ